ncbi:hypothetical protein SMIR_41020 (plasmid) [Streptomyces mirabilis]|uniref:hypothetical protein n=1 Tax=Streptomyces mirabilis TaxID=68239 RepID=UPI001BB04DDE|nr:hypothetical protein [Streptomyces mirabilis]QUW85463.1 hypothetical protein SMIR_41020 [Streptomyces mirabilis]
MNNRNVPLYVIVLATAAVGLLALGIAQHMLIFFGLVAVACFFLMRGMHGRQGGHKGSGQKHSDRPHKHL